MELHQTSSDDHILFSNIYILHKFSDNNHFSSTREYQSYSIRHLYGLELINKPDK